MNTDIRVKVSFRGHRKRRKLKMLIGPEATDYLLDFWIGVAMNHPEGILAGLDETDIALEAGWEGDPVEFVDALISAGFLEKNNGNFCVHDWEEHQPYVVHAKERSMRAKHAAQVRWEKRDTFKDEPGSMPDACGEHAGSMPEAMLNTKSSNAPSPAPTPSPIPTPTPNVKDISVDLYEFYVQEIGPAEKSKKRALTNIAKHLKSHTEDDLKAAIQNYKIVALKRNSEHRKNPANFFGIREKYFEDYLPENYEQAISEQNRQPDNLFKTDWY